MAYLCDFEREIELTKVSAFGCTVFCKAKLRVTSKIGSVAESRKEVPLSCFQSELGVGCGEL